MGMGVVVWRPVRALFGVRWVASLGDLWVLTALSLSWYLWVPFFDGHFVGSNGGFIVGWDCAVVLGASGGEENLRIVR
jgi:hypothetical protein